MWIVLGLGVAALMIAFGLIASPDARRLGTVRALTWATLFAILSGVLANLIAVFHHIARDDEAVRAPNAWLFQGLGESLAPAVLGFTVLSITWLVVAVAVRRDAE